MSKPASFQLRHAAMLFSLRTFAAAMLAFAIALRLDMPRPYWAMTSVYVTSNVLTGATSSKAVYRILGTLIGAEREYRQRSAGLRTNVLVSVGAAAFWIISKSKIPKNTKKLLTSLIYESDLDVTSRSS